MKELGLGGRGPGVGKYMESENEYGRDLKKLCECGILCWGSV